VSDAKVKDHDLLSEYPIAGVNRHDQFTMTGWIDKRADIAPKLA
jgi:hypothetical protein